VEEAFCDDIEALHATMHAFNRWLLETWSFQGPTVGAPLLSFADVDKALAELEWLLSEGARVINVCPGPVRGVGDVRHSPAHRRYDPIWQRINDAGVAIAYHAADTGYFRYFKDYDDPADYNAFSNQIRLGSLWSHDRPMQDMLAVMVMQRLFDRFPNLRIVSVEQGSSWLPVILKKLEKSYRQRPSLYAEDPTETIRRHLWMCPFWEDDIPQLVGLIGADRVVLGSDWPHPEGVEEPAQFAKYLDGLGDEQVEMVMRTNGRRLMTPAPIA
jgi:predicted TIM-barrel fold metal-dependent hydrolase